MTFPKPSRPISNKTIAQSHDPILQDSQLSACICLIQIVVVCVFCAYTLTIWPIADNLFSINPNWLPQTLKLLDTAGSLFTVIFWCSRPTCQMEWSVALAWIIILLLLFLIGDMHYDPTTTQQLMLGSFAIPCIFALLLRISGLTVTTESTLYESRLRWLILSMFLLLLPIYPALMLGKLFHVQTFDRFALHFDVLLSSTLVPHLRTFLNTIPGAPTVLLFAYGFTPLGFLAVALLQLRGRPKHVASALLVWVVSGPIAVLAYNFFPITGPGYVFDHINHAFLHADLYPLGMTTPPEGARNGMPSMHLGWMIAATMLWWQSGTSKYSRCLMIAQTCLVILATLYFGEHYLIDLIVSIPFMLSLIALCTTTISIHYAPRKHTILAGFLVWLLWVILLRTQLEFFMVNPWAAKGLVVLSLIIAAGQTYFLSQFKRIDSIVKQVHPKQEFLQNRCEEIS